MGKGSFVASRGRSHEHTEEVRDLPPRVQGGRLAADREPEPDVDRVVAARGHERGRAGASAISGADQATRPRARGEARRRRYALPHRDERRATTERITFAGTPKASPPDRGQLVAKAFPLFRAATPLEDVAEFLFLDPESVISLHAQWLALRQRTALWLGQPPPPAPGPRYDHEANADGSCCPAHTAPRMMTESK